MTCVHGPPWVHIKREAVDSGSEGGDTHKSFLLDKKFNQPFNVRFFPLELGRILKLFCMKQAQTHVDLVCGGDVRTLEEFLRVLPGPFFRYLDSTSFFLPLFGIIVLLRSGPVPPL